VKDASGNTLATVTIDQKLNPADYQDETGRWWEVVGVVSNLPPSSTTVWVGGSPGAQADAVRIIEIGPTAFKNTYDLAGNLTQVTDAKNNDTYFIRDNLNRVKEEKNELNESRYFEFYDNSQLKKATDRNGRVIEHFYDNLGRQTEERWKNGSTTVRSLTFGYNANGQMISADDDGAEGRDFDWFYDAMGRLSETKWRAADQGVPFDYTLINKYDANSRRTE
jgi:YD repeat-containing protein